MTLKEKLNDSIITNINIMESENRMYYNYNHLELAEICEKIADDFAIGFSMHISTHCNCELGNDTRSYQELLEIYKKEKQL